MVDRLLLQGLSGVAGAAKGSALRAFASGGASVQLGSMRRPVLDFTRLEARVDVGLTSSGGVGVCSDWFVTLLQCAMDV